MSIGNDLYGNVLFGGSGTTNAAPTGQLDDAYYLGLITSQYQVYLITE